MPQICPPILTQVLIFLKQETHPHFLHLWGSLRPVDCAIVSLLFTCVSQNATCTGRATPCKPSQTESSPSGIRVLPSAVHGPLAERACSCGLYLASEAGPDAQAVARDAVVRLSLQCLAHGLVFQLVILADPIGAGGALHKALGAACMHDRASACFHSEWTGH